MSFSWSLTRAHMHTVTIHTHCRKHANRRWMEPRGNCKWWLLFRVIIYATFAWLLLSDLHAFTLHLCFSCYPSISISLALFLQNLPVSLHLCSVMVCMYSQLVLVTALLACHTALAMVGCSYITLKRQSIPVTWGMFTGCYIVCVCVLCCIHWH